MSFCSISYFCIYLSAAGHTTVMFYRFSLLLLLSDSSELGVCRQLVLVDLSIVSASLRPTAV